MITNARKKWGIDAICKERGIKISPPQRKYLNCLVLEHVARAKKKGTLLVDVSFDDLEESYQYFLYDHYLNEVLTIPEISLDVLGDNGVF